MSKNKSCWIVDAFVGTASECHLRGNPAAVVLLEQWPEEAWLQAIAAEFNLSETAFIKATGADSWDLRWFTPTCEVDLCGHATLATAFVLVQELKAEHKVFRFATRSGELKVTVDENEPTLLWLDFPAQELTSTEPPPALLQALGLEEVVAALRASDDWLLEVAQQEVVASLKPDFVALKAITRQLGARGIIMTAPAADKRYDFVSRFFGPAVGINEDPVTGSAHAKLAPYWSQKLGRDDLCGLQLSARGGMVLTRWQGERVLLGGKARLRMRGEILES